MTEKTIDWYTRSKEQTAIANQAEYRATAIGEVLRGLIHMEVAYKGNEETLEVIGAFKEQFKTMFKERREKLLEIAAIAREKATQAVDMWNRG